MIHNAGVKIIGSPQQMILTPALWIMPTRFPQCLQMKNFCSWLMDVSSFDVCVVAAPFRRG